MSPTSPRVRPPSPALAVFAAVGLLAWAGTTQASTLVYKWVDAAGVTHLSSAKPPAGVNYERVKLASTTKRSTSGGASGQGGGASTRVSTAGATPEQASRRNEMVSSLRNRECVIALESIDRMGKGGQAVDPAEFRRLQQTADQNCSKDPVQRGEQEEMAARLRVSKSDACVDARNKLADMLAPGRKPAREQLKVQQEFIESHCTAPVR